MPVVLEVDFDITDTYHESHHCNDGTKVLSYHMTHNITPPSKQFISNNFNNCGEYVGSELSILNYSTESHNGCSRCGGKKVYVASDARIINQDDTLLQKMLDSMSSDIVKPNIVKPNIAKPNIAKPNTKHHTKHHTNQQLHCTRFLSPGYKLRCAKIKCSWGMTCNRKNNPSNPCYYNHSI
jgi:hypothetical protein